MLKHAIADISGRLGSGTIWAAASLHASWCNTLLKLHIHLELRSAKPNHMEMPKILTAEFLAHFVLSPVRCRGMP